VAQLRGKAEPPVTSLLVLEGCGDMEPVAALQRVVPKYCRKFLLPYQFRSIIFNGYEDLSAMAPYDTRCALLVLLPLFQPLLIVANGPHFSSYSLVRTGRLYRGS
jgi:hypothetical protein